MGSSTHVTVMNMKRYENEFDDVDLKCLNVFISYGNLKFKKKHTKIKIKLLALLDD